MTKKWTRVLAYGFAALLLCVALIYYNFVDKPTSFGTECPAFTAETFVVEDGTFTEGGVISSQEQRGKIFVINFWDRTCEPCVKELWEFNEIQEEYGDAVQVVAFSVTMSSKGQILTFLQNQTWRTWDPSHDWTTFSIGFAHLTDADALKTLGFSGLVPRTVIVDADGKIAYGNTGSLTYEALKEEIDKLL